MIKRNLITFFGQLFCLALVFSLARLLFLIYNWVFFQDFPFSEIALSMLLGIRFDLVVIAQTTGFICFLFFILGNWSRHKIVDKIFFLITVLFLFVFVSLYLADLSYYHLIKRHISFEVTLVLNDLPGAIRQAFSGYYLMIIFYLILLGLIALGWYKFWRKLRSIPDQKAPLLKHILVIPLLAVLLIIMGRGGLQSRPTDEKFAFRNQHVQLGNLTLNAPYTVGLMLTRNRVTKMEQIDEKLAALTIKKFVGLRDDEFLDAEYPFLRKSNSRSKYRDPLSNVVFIILEGIPAIWTGSFNPAIVSDTPKIDAIAFKGLRFTRFFGTGNYTAQAFGAMMASIPALPTITLIDSSFVQNNYLSIPRVLDDLDYDSLFLTGYFEGSASIDSFMKSLGIRKVLTQSNFKDYDQISNTWGLWDEYTFKRFYQEITQLKPPFLAIVEPSATHSPHNVPDEKWAHYPKSEYRHGWKNMLRYSDHFVGEFFKDISTLDSFNNTLFVIISDHVSNIDPEHYADSARLPLILYTPGGQIPPGENDVVGSQTDLLPTIMDYLGLSKTHASTGRSLFASKRGEGFALHFNGTFLLWFQKNTVTRYLGLKPDGHFNLDLDWNNKNNLIGNTDMTEINNSFLSYIQSVQNGLLSNKILK